MWKKPRLARNAHYFVAGLSLCTLWNGWPGWLMREQKATDTACQSCYRALYERRVIRTNKNDPAH